MKFVERYKKFSIYLDYNALFRDRIYRPMVHDYKRDRPKPFRVVKEKHDIIYIVIPSLLYLREAYVVIDKIINGTYVKW